MKTKYIYQYFIIILVFSCNSKVEEKKKTENDINDSVSLQKSDSNLIANKRKEIISFFDTHIDTVMKTVYQYSYKENDEYFWFSEDKEILNNLLISKKDTIFSKNVFLDSIAFNNKNWLILITENKPRYFNFHSSAPYIEAIIFEKKDGKWIFNFRSLFARLGSWGQIPKFEIPKIGKDRYGILFYMGFTNQGYTVENLLLYTIGTKGIKKVLEIKDAAMDNKGVVNEKNWGYKYDIKFIDNNLEYYDINFSTKGTYLDDDIGKIKTINKATNYSFQKEEYKEK